MRRIFLMAVALGAIGSATMTGCGLGLPPEPQEMTKTLFVTPVVAEADRQVLATVTAFTKADVATLTLKLMVLNGTTETQVATSSLTNAQLSQTVSFKSLKANTTYRVRAEARTSGNALISVPEQSFLDLTVTTDDRPSMATLGVKLIDSQFNGQATSGPIAFTNGALVPAGVETISQP